MAFSGKRRCSDFASSHGARIHTSRSSSVDRMTTKRQAAGIRKATAAILLRRLVQSSPRRMYSLMAHWRQLATAAPRDSIYSFTLAKGPMAGALIGCPSTSNIEPWHGQSQQVSKLFQCRWQPT